MKSFTTFATFAIAMLLSIAASSTSARTRGPRVKLEKSIISYLGTNYLMPDGCPLPSCDITTSECQRTHSMVRALYSHCLQGEDGQHVGCITDRLGDGSSLTIPVYASVCSAMCYESNPNSLTRIKRCPYPGYRQHNPALSHLFR